jgi:hypothetical protein
LYGFLLQGGRGGLKSWKIALHNMWTSPYLTDGFKNSSSFFQKIVKQSKNVRHPTCLETIFILIPNFPQISTKNAPENQKRTIYHEFNQFWWIFNILYVLWRGLFINNFQIFIETIQYLCPLPNLTPLPLKKIREIG